MKFVLGLIALVLIGLMLYVYTGKDHKQPQKQTVHKTVKEETPSKEVVTSVEKPKPVVQHTVKKESLKVESTSSKVQNTSNSDGEIGEDLTLESIKNADVSDEEKERMISLAAYRETSAKTEKTELSEEDFLKVLKNHFNNTNK